jgi:hypothetical protein
MKSLTGEWAREEGELSGGALTQSRGESHRKTAQTPLLASLLGTFILVCRAAVSRSHASGNRGSYDNPAPGQEERIEGIRPTQTLIQGAPRSSRPERGYAACRAGSLFCVEGGFGPARAEIFEITNTNDSGDGSLWATITEANGNGQADTIKVTATGIVVLGSTCRTQPPTSHA